MKSQPLFLSNLICHVITLQWQTKKGTELKTIGTHEFLALDALSLINPVDWNDVVELAVKKICCQGNKSEIISVHGSIECTNTSQCFTKMTVAQGRVLFMASGL